MKSIGIVTDGVSELGKFLKENLEMVLKNHVQINNYYIKSLKDDFLIEDDLILIMIDKKLKDISKYIKSKDNVIVIERTIMLSAYHELLNIPAGIDVLVVNDDDETTKETVELLIELGITHINLIPYEKEGKYKNIQLAITPGEKRYVPSYLDEVIDIGNRYIDISTFFVIISKLSLNHDEIIIELKKYLELIVSLYSGMKEKVREIFVKKQELSTLFELANDGILITNKNGKVRHANRKFCELFNIEEINDRNMKQLLPQKWINKLQTDDILENTLFENDKKVFNINKKPLTYLNSTYGYYYIFQELTYIKQLEQSLSSKLRNLGHVAKYTFDDIIAKSDSMEKTIEVCKKIAKTDLTVLLIGESGTGKEMLAQSIHNESNRKNQPFIAINSAAMPENLLESELFGYEEGAFTGALKGGKKGLLAQANHGTVFLDEIGDMSIHLQTKLLRVLQEKQIMALGSSSIMDIDIRFIVATNKNLEVLSLEDKFRTDLYYRINTCQINLPPLRDRKSDIVLIAENFLGNEYKIDNSVKDTLLNHDYRGNIRELINILNYAKAISSNDIIKYEDLPEYIINKQNQSVKLERIYSTQSNNKVDKARFILETINNHGSIGRNMLIRLAEKENVQVKEAELKKILTNLKNQGFVDSGKGRAGTYITQKGLEELSKQL